MKRNNFFTFVKGILLIQVFLLVIIVGLSVDISSKYINLLHGINPENILIPFSGLQIDKNRAESLFRENNLLLGENYTDNMLLKGLLGNVSPEKIISTHIMALAYTDMTDVQEDDQSENRDTIDNNETADTTEIDTLDPKLFKDSKIYLYCTHSAESYIPDSGKARLDGKRGLINEVASNLEKECNDKSLPAVFINTIHDYPDYNKSYSFSRKTVSSIIKSNQNIEAIFDIHRDSIPKISTASTVKINGKNCSQILIIVGSDERKPHPKWQQNYQFAKQLYAQAGKTYPGLIKGVTTKAGTYNQEFNTHALLLEFGTDYNTVGEANYAAELFSNVLIKVLEEEKK